MQINRYNFETVDLLRSSFSNWGRDLRAARCAPADANAAPPGCNNVQLHLAEINFESMRDTERRAALRLMPTSFALPKESVDELRSTARDLLRNSAEFQQFLRAVAVPQ